jgi:putative peptide zinc metalloprotease protein
MRPTASIDRPLALRTRPDLVAAPVEMAGTATWVIKDPLSLEHFQFTAEEYALIDRLRRPASIADLQREFARRFPPQSISPEAVWDFVRRLHEAGLVIGEAAGQGHELLSRERGERTRQRALAWMQILAIRFRGFDPDRFLTALHDRTRWAFSPAAWLLVAAVVGYALSLVLGHLETFHQRLPALTALADVRNLGWLLAVIGLVKVLHELGHALACKHFGGEVRELGFMLLVFSPCLYCDVSDSWRFPSKWQRIAVAAAGMAVELVLAAVATIVWWHAQPGVIALVAMNVMIVATVGTLLVNGNPLLRYDGYYILSDLVEQPNLWQRSRDVLRRAAARWVLGEDPPEDPLLPARGRTWLAFYAVASKLYIAIVCVAIVWGLVVFLYLLHLQNLAYGLGIVMLCGAIYQPAASASRLLRDPARRTDFPIRRAALVSALGLAALVAILALPVNYYVRAPLVVLPADAARVYSSIDGSLADALAPGEQVAAGQTIARLMNPEVELELTRLEGERREQQLRVEHLDRLRSVDPQASEQLPTARAMLAAIEARLSGRRREAARLTLAAPRDGVMIEVPRTPPASDDDGKLPTWSGRPLDAANRGARIEPVTLVCLVGDPSDPSAVLLVEDTDAHRLRPGQSVRMRLEQLPGQVVTGKVVEVARHELRDNDESGPARNQLDTLFTGLIAPGTSRAHYQVRVTFDTPSQPLIFGGRGHAKVAAERIPLARTLWRFLAKTFRLPVG